MKNLFGAMAILSIIVVIGGNVWWNYTYSRDVSGFIELADDASTAHQKLEFLESYREAVLIRIPNEKLRLIFTTPRHSRKTQLKVLDSLIQRLKEADKMQADSMAYQQAMLQISGQEFEHSLEDLNSIFHYAAWMQGWTFWFTIISVIIIILFIIIISILSMDE